tara:strand:+ start:1531 stop:3093 length:1563 start_codon:yes stop_codon:yes gene_type:complete
MGGLSWFRDTTIPGPITVIGDIDPSAADTYDLGSPTLEWNALYIGEASGSGVYFGTDQHARVYSDGTNLILTMASGHFSLNSDTRLVDVHAGTEASPSLRIGGDGSSGIYRISSGIWGFASSGDLKFSMRTDGIAVDPTKKIYLDGGVDTYIHEPSGNVFEVVTGDAARLRAHSLGIGIPATAKFYLDGVAGSTDTYIHESSPDVLDLVAGGKTVSLTGTGNVLISDGGGLVVGHTAQVTSASAAKLQVLGTGLADASIILGRWSTTNSDLPLFVFVKSGNAAIGSKTAVADGESLGGLNWRADDGHDYNTNAASIMVEVNGAVTTNRVPADIIINTNPGGSDDAIREVWRITAAGVLTAGGGSPSNAATTDGAVLATGGIAFTDVADAWIDDATHGSGTVTHYIGNETIDTTASDDRLKINVSDANGLSSKHLRILANNLQEYDYLTGRKEGMRFVGFGARHLHENLPQYVNVGEGNNNWSVDYKYMVGPLIKGWDEHDSRVTELEQELAELKAIIGEP